MFTSVKTLVADCAKLPSQYRDHALKGDAIGRRECHIGGPKSDWLLVYERDDTFQSSPSRPRTRAWVDNGNNTSTLYMRKLVGLMITVR